MYRWKTRVPRDRGRDARLTRIDLFKDSASSIRGELAPDETVALHTRPHFAWLLARIPEFLKLSIGNVVVALFAALCGSVTLGGRIGPDLGSTLLLVWVLGIPAVYVMHRVATWLTTHYVVTNRRVFIAHGIIRRDSLSVPLAQITNLSSNQSAVDRLFGSGDLLIESGGRESTIMLYRLPHIKMAHTRVLSLLPTQRPSSA